MQPRNEEHKEEKKEGFAREPLVERAGKKAGIALLAAGLAAGCTYQSSSLPSGDGGTDAHQDAGMDGGADAGPDLDAGPDSGLPDAGTDAGFDAGTDGGGPLCVGVFNEAVVNGAFDKNVPRAVGGYSFNYTAYTTSTVTMDIRCGSDSSGVALGQVFTVGVEAVIDVPADSKRIRVTVNSKNTFTANCDVTVENL